MAMKTAADCLPYTPHSLTLLASTRTSRANAAHEPSVRSDSPTTHTAESPHLRAQPPEQLSANERRIVGNCCGDVLPCEPPSAGGGEGKRAEQSASALQWLQ
jgi:hypothetical protein